MANPLSETLICTGTICLIVCVLAALCVLTTDIETVSTTPVWLMAVTMSFPLTVLGIILTVKAIPMIASLVRRSPIVNSATAAAIVASLSKVRSWKNDNGRLTQEGGLVLVVKGERVCASGLFDCEFGRKDSARILRAVDGMRSSKLTDIATTIDDEGG